ncbi:class I SAM-dependent methyltransferase [Streptomyces ipomoeae]|uniref:class I SAM-dependent methyltransferase n=1 Tax=Streptomyces ipomoeae TaxID=103232 RepID=UPI001146772C|nr:class I SAM-dependent methyltransferase [Streptomyces ipomoeae]MDX2934421.1 class I SAM-dependent methyltransferase [Streptomyces ipomoeae]TQE17443.1 class I SAM-dependent methyltransferase [Streptomyces ipomoeae]
MLRAIFNEAAELYDQARPRYPDSLVAELAARTGLGPGSCVLEIGPGTGQLTVPVAEFGCDITAVELGPAMAEVARRNLRPFPRARVEVAEFEQWPLPAEPFDVVMCATAFHWIDPAVRVAKVGRALRPGGTFALVTTEHVKGGTLDFFARVQEAYEYWDPSTPPGLRLRDESEIATDTAELAGWDDLRSYRCTREITYSTQEYIDVLLTYSGHRALDAPSREGLLGAIRELIDTRHGGRITKCYLHELITARRPAEIDGH